MSNSKNPLDVQIGGQHYKKFGIQPVELYNNFNLGFGEANLIKYSMRHKDKNGLEDLEKVIHYAELMIKFNNPIGKFIPIEYVDKFSHVNSLSIYARTIIEEVSLWILNGSIVHLRNIQYLTESEIRDNYR